MKAGPAAKAKAVPVHAGVLFRFAKEMQTGDVVIFPSKHDRMVNIGTCTGKLYYVAGDSDGYPNRRGVKWFGHIPRNDFS